ncbi:efflux RND transporter permease subunit [Desulfovibrio subterraneus]|uniref:Multidrug efflux RND transporter permease subunit n=1 Tax=Desulfovibrio subterraneus TaxID=2718620 RepID=A0A7J0BMK4_9BACT|nr:efflux RND transporter permease subunit [Desulfovibrio subterraneus]GFM34889.1 multidrug efflux RND transporter permease subunit [Desulfovibrio subterraneus]
MAAFFINRPIFAWVIAIVIMLAGVLALGRLPVAHYPDIALPQISISAQYPGASASIVDRSVTQIIEQQLKGLDNLLHMSSTSGSSSGSEINLTFTAGTDIDTAQVQVQNKLQQAMSLLPEAVQRQGVQAFKAVENSFMTVALYDARNMMRASDISDYVASSLVDPLSRIQGVGSVTLYGSQNAMRIWCDPDKMRQYRLNPQDVLTAIREQNSQVAGGQVGESPAPPGQEINIAINASSSLETVEQFEQILLRVEENGAVLLLKDVARIELNEESATGGTYFNGHAGTGLSFKLSSGANVLKTTQAIKAELEALAAFFPPGLTYAYAEDKAPIVEKSIQSVVRTLLEAIALVVVVMFLFLQSFRATLVSAIAVPVVLLGVFAVLAVAGFSINTLTMFGMVLAIGLLVDDAIVVVENVERLMREEKLSAREAALKSMRQITGALVGVAVVISAVFIPMAFISGSTGSIFRQFSITIVASMVLSVVVAIVLTPALCATILTVKKHRAEAGVFGRFNRWFDALTGRYAVQVAGIVKRPKTWTTTVVFVVAMCAVLFSRLPDSFLPDEDQGILYVDVQLPSGASQERTEKIVKEIDEYFRTEEKDAIQSVMSVVGWGFSGSGQSSAMVFPLLKDWSERGQGQGVFDVMERASARFSSIHGADIVVMAPPAAMDLGTSSGFEMELMDRGGNGRAALLKAKDALLEDAAKRPSVSYARYGGMEDAEQYDLLINNGKAGAYGLSRGDINNAISAYWAGEYINDFSDRGRTKKVYFQAEPSFRTGVDDFRRYYLRNAKDEMVPFSNFLAVKSGLASPSLTRYQGIPSVKIEGAAVQGKSSGQAMLEMEESAAKLPSGFDYAWTGLSYQQRMASNQAPLLYAISIIVVFLSLAALYESWTIPLAVLMAVPTGVIGALGGVYLRGMNNDIYFQIALLTIVGLSAKNSILIVEFARALHHEGKDLLTATVEASRLRLRPVLMTSLCFILGVVPLAFSTGAGSAAQNALGTAVMAGMITATGLGVYYTPLFFVLVTRLFGRKKGHEHAPASSTVPNA